MILGEDPTDELDRITLTAEKHKQQLYICYIALKFINLKQNILS